MQQRILAGFTLIELVIGMVVFSIVLAIITTLIASQARNSVEPMLQVRATELAQSLLNEISAKSFDENSDRAGGLLRCGETGASHCSAINAIGPDGETRASFDDVDDYHGLNQTDNNISNSQGEELTVAGRQLYSGFRAQVSVVYDDNQDGVADTTIGSKHKLITVTITTPSKQSLIFSTYRSNY